MRGEHLSTGRSGASRTMHFLAAACFVLLLAAFTGLYADYYYDLNDDVLIKDILAGVQTGAPSGYSIQMLYPVSILISFFYRLFRNAPWYGIFLCACQYGCFFLIAFRCLGVYGIEAGRGKTPPAWAAKCALLGLEGILILSLFFRELVFVQYSVVCALLAGTAAFWLYTVPAGRTVSGFWREALVSVLLAVLAFHIRTEMLLLLLPLLCAAGAARWLREAREEETGEREDFFREGVSRKKFAWKSVYKKELLLKFIPVAGALALGIGAGYAADALAYGGGEWKEFLRFFNARTEIYDFYGIPAYENNRDFYESIGMGPGGQELLENYNFGLDTEIDAALLERIEERAGELYAKEHPPGGSAREAVWKLAHRLLPAPSSPDGYRLWQEDRPWNLVTPLLYGMVLLGALLYAKYDHIINIIMLFLARSVSWMYILYRDRAPERITHSLYLVECLILLAFLMEALREGQSPARRRQRAAACAAFGILAFAGACFLPGALYGVRSQQAVREEKNAPYRSLMEYCRRNQEHYYYVDVRSTVDFSEKMFKKVDNSGRNYDIIGGWACKSPLSREPEGGLPEYFIIRSDKEIGWLPAFYEEKGRQVRPVRLETADGLDPYWAVYRLEEQEENVE